MQTAIPQATNSADPDIFVSYACVDHPEVSIGGVEGGTTRWVLRFAEALEHAVGFELGRKVKVWVDLSEIRSTNRVGAVLTRELERSRLMVALMSKGWLNSSWCSEELHAFRRIHGGDALDEDVVVVELHPLERRWANLIDVAGRPFYRKVGADTYLRHGHPLPRIEDIRFFDEIALLASESARRLDRIETSPSTAAGRAAVKAAGQAAAAPPLQPPWLWLANTGPSLAIEQRRLIETLAQENFDVVEPQVGGKQLLPRAEVEADVRASMVGASVLVQLLDEFPGVSVAGSQATWPALQGELAREHEVAMGVPFVRWRRPGSLESSDETWRRSLVGVVEQDIEQFSAELLKRLRGMRESMARTPNIVASAPELCLTYAEEDYRVAEKVGELLDEWQVRYQSVVTAAQLPDPGVADRKDDEDSQMIRTASGVVIVYGRAAREWLASTVKHLHHLRGRRGRWGVLIDAPGIDATGGPTGGPTGGSTGGPHKPMPPLASTIERHDWRERPQPDLLRRFIASLRLAPQG